MIEFSAKMTFTFPAKFLQNCIYFSEDFLQISDDILEKCTWNDIPLSQIFYKHISPKMTFIFIRIFCQKGNLHPKYPLIQHCFQISPKAKVFDCKTILPVSQWQFTFQICPLKWHSFFADISRSLYNVFLEGISWVP